MTDKKFKNQNAFYNFEDKLGFNWAVCMFMIDAMQKFKDMDKGDLRDCAFEIAFLGYNGINPDGVHKYTITAFPGKEFSGYHLLAYYYVSWAIAIPGELDNLLLPYKKEYEMAEQMYKAKMFKS